MKRLMEFLTALGHDVEIRINRTHKPRGQRSVVVAASGVGTELPKIPNSGWR